MRVGRLLLFTLYGAYLVHVGLAMLLVPWSPAWASLVIRLPEAVAAIVDQPAVRGAVSAFGLLHLALAGAEILLPESLRRAP